MAELRLGYKASAEQFAPRELVELAVLAEAAGMDSATVSDHFQPWRHNGGHAPFSLAWMTAVGERTQRLVLGTSVLTPTFRYNPAVIAQAFATMGCLYPNRIFLGVGTGEALNEIATGYQGEWPEFKERYARLRESVRLMRELWPRRLRRRVLQDQGRLDLRRALRRHPDLYRRGWSAGRQVRRPRG
jgi:coenzyme F420-dependent glucose-6-phosphate dehydrogenase